MNSPSLEFRAADRDSGFMFALPPLPRPPLSSVLGMILAGGRGSRLDALTAWRAKPAVPFGDGFRIIDFTLGNCLNSGVPDVGVLTQYQAQSLAPHLDSWARFAARAGRSITTLTPAADGSADYQGTADAVYRNLEFIRSHAPRQVLILAGDHIYNMDYGAMLAQHVRRGAGVTIGCVEVPLAQASAFGIMQVDADERICGFAEKPSAPQAIPGRCDTALASMGIYLFDTDFLLELLHRDAALDGSAHDFGHDVIPAAVAAGAAYACSLRDVRDPSRPGYWRDVGTVDAYWHCNLEMLSAAGLDAGCRNWPLWNEARIRCATLGGKAMSATSVSPAAEVIRSVLASDVHIAGGSHVEDCVVLPGVSIGAHCRIRKAVIEEGCRLPAGIVIGLDADQDRLHFHVSPGGAVLVTSAMLERQALAA